VKRLVDLLGGTIELHSARGCGTDVRVRFTADAAPAELPAAGAAGAADKAAQQPLSGRVLLAEDNAINVQIASRILQDARRRGRHRRGRRPGRRAVPQSAPGTYRAILMDIQMPLVNGYEATEQIRALARPDAKTIPIIAMTADAFSAAEERSRAAGMNGYLTKPIDPRRLQAALEACAP
jgi:CheY-like chemotaxis protein